MEYQGYKLNIPNIQKWFNENSINELGFINWKINQIKSENAKILAKAIFSKIILKVSNQDSETRYKSIEKDIKQGDVINIFIKGLQSSFNKVKISSQLLRYRRGRFIIADLRKDQVMSNNSVDLIISSPPYPNATDYHLYHRFRLFWLGYNPVDLGKKEIGSHLRHQKEKTGIDNYLNEMSLCLLNMFKSLRHGRYAVLILGDAIFKGEIFKTAELIKECALKTGFEFVGIIPRKIHKTKRSFANPAQRLKQEKILILRKPGKFISMNLFSPPYKMWEYEKVLQKSEIEEKLGCIPSIKEENMSIEIDSLKSNHIKSMSFIHSFESEHYHKEKTWQSILENGDSLFESNRKDPKYVTHGIHPYKGKFYPQLVKSLMNIANFKINDTIFDPFCGSGTTLLEGYLNGYNTFGFEINPNAYKIATVKTEILLIDPYIVDKTLAKTIDLLKNYENKMLYKDVFDENIHHELLSWFPEPVLNKIAFILQIIEKTITEITIQNFLEVCLSSIIRDISQQEPKDLRIRRRKNPILDADVIGLFKNKVKEQC